MFNVWLPLLPEILANMCIVIIYLPAFDIMNHINLSRFPERSKNSEQKFELLQRIKDYKFSEIAK